MGQEDIVKESARAHVPVPVAHQWQSTPDSIEPMLVEQDERVLQGALEHWLWYQYQLEPLQRHPAEAVPLPLWHSPVAAHHPHVLLEWEVQDMQSV